MVGVVSSLIVSLSGHTDASPQSLRRAAAFADEMDARGVPVSQLLRPRTAAGPLRPGSALVSWLHERGDAIVLHGYDHADGNRRVGRRAEFAALPRHEAGLRLIAARRVLTAVGLRTDLFAPPRWLASEGTVEALREQGFGVLADENGVHPLQGGDVALARVLGFRMAVADEQRAAEAWRCRLFVAEVARTTRRGGLVRINVRAKDLKRTARRDAVLTAVDAALVLGAQPATYRPAGGRRAA